MNAWVPFFASLMAMTTHKIKGGKNLQNVGTWSIGELQEKKTKDKMGRGNGRVVTNLEGNGALKNKKLPFCSFFLTKNKPNHPNTIGVMFHPKIRNPN